MRYTDGEAGCTKPSPDLHQASRISADDQIRSRSRGREGGDLHLEHIPCHARPKYRVNTSASAAAIGPRQDLKPQRGDGTKQRQRGILNTLRVLEMTGGIIGHLELDRCAGVRAPLCKKL